MNKLILKFAVMVLALFPAGKARAEIKLTGDVALEVNVGLTLRDVWDGARSLAIDCALINGPLTDEASTTSESRNYVGYGVTYLVEPPSVPFVVDERVTVSYLEGSLPDITLSQSVKVRVYQLDGSPMVQTWETGFCTLALTDEEIKSGMRWEDLLWLYPMECTTEVDDTQIIACVSPDTTPEDAIFKFSREDLDAPDLPGVDE